jgi:hypothetical protein
MPPQVDADRMPVNRASASYGAGDDALARVAEVERTTGVEASKAPTCAPGRATPAARQGYVLLDFRLPGPT